MKERPVLFSAPMIRAILAGAKRKKLYAPPDDKLLCEACELSAVLAGLPSAYELAGRHVHLGRIKAVRVCCVGGPS